MAFYEWTCERITKLLDMRLNGFTATQIGRALGISRSAVMGKANRLGVCRPDTQSENGAMGGRAARRLKRRAHYNSRFEPTPPKLKRPGTIPAELPALHASVPVAFADLKSYHCRWPIGDPRNPEFCFCGAHHERGTMYCASHYEVSVRRQGDVKD